MTNEELVRAALEKVGGKSNVLTATNCMTRLRVRVKDDAKIDDEGLKAIEGVMGIVHDRTGYVEIVVGPGKCRKCADICRDMGIPPLPPPTTGRPTRLQSRPGRSRARSRSCSRPLAISLSP